MGLAVRIIPTLLCRGKSLVKGRQFKADRVIGHAQQAVRIHQQRGVDELMLLDVDATPKGKPLNADMVLDLADECFMPLTVGGGIKSLSDVKTLLDAGADKVCINTAGYDSPGFIQEVSGKYGSQAVVVSIDVMDGKVVTHCGIFPRKLSPIVWAKTAESMGAGEIVLTSVDREGTMGGYDLELIRSVSEAVNIPVIAHGGCLGPADMLAAIQVGASAVAAGALFAFTETTPKDCARYLADQNVEVRL